MVGMAGGPDGRWAGQAARGATGAPAPASVAAGTVSPPGASASAPEEEDRPGADGRADGDRHRARRRAAGQRHHEDAAVRGAEGMTRDGPAAARGSRPR